MLAQSFLFPPTLFLGAADISCLSLPHPPRCLSQPLTPSRLGLQDEVAIPWGLGPCCPGEQRIAQQVVLQLPNRQL